MSDPETSTALPAPSSGVTTHSVDAGANSPAAPVRRPRKAPSRIWRRTTMRRAIAEAVILFAVGRLVAMVPLDVWPPLLFPAVLLGRTALFILPPVWAAARVVSTKREKMSRRFWKLGPNLALYCVLVDALVSLVFGEATLLGGAAGPADLARFAAHGAQHLSIGGFIVGAAVQLVELAIYYTIAVVCTRLANGGFMRFTMPAGEGRVTL